jgi:hydroxymethylglutaryl-CoA lyase
MSTEKIRIVECPRDAMQGLHHQVPTDLKIEYLNSLLRVGFDTLDFGSFVSPKAVPQMADTAEVLAGLQWEHTDTDLLAIVANRRGAEDACRHQAIAYLGYPFSISETFQQRNTRKSIAESLRLVEEIHALCQTHGKELVVYISMAFGNPYGDAWEPAIVEKWVEEMVQRGIKTIALADTVGNADPETIRQLFSSLIPRFPNAVIGAHFHSAPGQRKAKLAAAYESGCRRFDTALMGYGGCPFAKDELVGNIATESFLAYCEEAAIETGIEQSHLSEALTIAPRVFLG